MLYAVAFIGGMLAVASPCILPVLPFVFARAEQPFRRSGLPMLIGMALTFVAVGTLATVAGEWVIRANQLGRLLAMLLFGVFGIALIVPAVADRLAAPFVKLGSAVDRHGARDASIGASVLLGVSTGLLWTPCAGPILGLILTGAAVQGANGKSAGLLLAFGIGSTCALAVVLLAGNRAFQLMKRSLGVEAWIRRALGAAVLAGVIIIALGWDTGLLTRVALSSGATAIEQQLIDRTRSGGPAAAGPADAPTMTMTGNAPTMTMSGRGSEGAPAMTMAMKGAAAGETAAEQAMPSLDGATAWINSGPLTREGLRGKVVLIDFWTYSCINCLRALPYVQAWADKYKSAGLVVIGVHSPEFAFERDVANVRRAVRDLKVTYPVAVDSSLTIWRAFKNEYWPAHYFVDPQGRIVFHHFGEGAYEESEQVIQALLAQKNGSPAAASGLASVTGVGVKASPDIEAVRSPETYVGYARQENWASPEPIAHDQARRYTLPARPSLNQWGLDGSWTVGDEKAVLSAPPGKISFRFHARDLHLVMGPGADGKPVRFHVLLDGAPVANDAGGDVDRQGDGAVTEYRLYQVIRQKGTVEDRTFEIEFLDPGVQAFSFTFG